MGTGKKIRMMSTVRLSTGSWRATSVTDKGTQNEPTQETAWSCKGIWCGQIQMLASVVMGRMSLGGHRDLIHGIKTVFNNVDLVFYSGSHYRCILQSSNLRDVEGSQA